MTRPANYSLYIPRITMTDSAAATHAAISPDTGASFMISGTWGAPTKEPARGLFEIEVDGLLGFSLIPKNDLAREMCSVWLGGDFAAAVEGTSHFGYTPSIRANRLRFTKKPPALLSSGGDPFSNGRRLAADEHAVALAAIEKHRAAKARASKRTKRAAKKSRRSRR